VGCLSSGRAIGIPERDSFSPGFKKQSPFRKVLRLRNHKLRPSAVVLLLGFFMGYRITDWVLFPFALAVMFMIALLFNLLGTALATKFDDMHYFPMIMNFVIMPMVFISGAMFPVDNFPQIIRFFIMINPFNYCNDLLRYTLGSVSAIIHSSILLSYRPLSYY
jgi:ABC-type polysaccharide/polyol phosphate export permease